MNVCVKVLYTALWVIQCWILYLHGADIKDHTPHIQCSHKHLLSLLAFIHSSRITADIDILLHLLLLSSSMFS